MRHGRAFGVVLLAVLGLVAVVLIAGLILVPRLDRSDSTQSAARPDPAQAQPSADAPVAMSAPADGPASDPVPASGDPIVTRPLPPGPVARRAQRWVPTTDAEPLPARSALNGEPVTVLPAGEGSRAGEGSAAGEQIALAVAGSDWERLRNLLGTEVPALVIEDLRRARELHGRLRFVHRLADNDNATFLLGFSDSAAVLRVYRLGDSIVDLELLDRSLSVSADLPIQ